MSRVVLVYLLFVTCAAGQEASQQPEHDMSKMQMPGMNEAGGMLMNLTSGTSMSPESSTMPMEMVSADGWNFIFMGQAFLVDTQQTGPRGADKFYSPDWGMFAAGHDVGHGSVLFDLMLSLDPATITERSYPELFQTGETAFGKPLVDAQHPHNFIMALGVHYAHPLGESMTLELYFAPVGDPALGPVAFPHRSSAAELPEAPLSHHWQDSTHVSDEVVTAGLRYKKVRLEGSGFYGTEPGENRWDIDHGPINSWSTRLSWFPSRNWLAQVSVGRLAHPEMLLPGDVVRATASLQYTRPMQGSSWSSNLIWGRNHDTFDHRNSNAYLIESVAPYREKNFFTGRAERVDKDELFLDDPDVEAFLDRTAGSTFRIGAYTAGYTRDIGVSHHAETGLGFNFTAYTTPAAIKPYYGQHPTGWNIFARVRLK